MKMEEGRSREEEGGDVEEAPGVVKGQADRPIEVRVSREHAVSSLVPLCEAQGDHMIPVE